MTPLFYLGDTIKNMADEIDIANERAQFLLEQRIKAAMIERKPYGPAECAECADEMPEPRRKLGMLICFECATRREHRQKLLGR